MSDQPSVSDFMGSALPATVNGNSSWASRYAHTLRKVIVHAAEHSPRSMQGHLGPSELGVPCDRQVVGKMAGLARTNHVVDPWPSIIGTAVHSWLADAFERANVTGEIPRWVPEHRVTPHPAHPGTSDLYDTAERAVVDHKVLGPTSMAKVRSISGPPIHYVLQILLYALGYRNLGLPVDRVAIVAYPRAGATLDGMYVWERECVPGDQLVIDELFRRTEVRRQLAEAVRCGTLSISAIPTQPDDDLCYFCPFYRPQSARDGGPGCPGNRT